MYSYPLDEAADIAFRAASEFVSTNPDAIYEIIWVLFDAGTKAAYDKVLDVLDAEISVDDMNESYNGTNDPIVVGFSMKTRPMRASVTGIRPNLIMLADILRIQSSL